MQLLQRIDAVLKQRGKTRAELARELGISTQAINSLKHRPNATMKHENLVRAAQLLGCDVNWLATGKNKHGTVILQVGAPEPKGTSLAAPNLVVHDVARTLAAEARAQMVMHMWLDLSSEQDRNDVVAFIAERLARAKREAAKSV